MNYRNAWQKELNNLLNKWDPIGVNPFKGGPQGEYDCFVEPILKLLDQGKSQKSILAFLRKYLMGHIGVEPENVHPEKFSKEIVK